MFRPLFKKDYQIAGWKNAMDDSALIHMNLTKTVFPQTNEPLSPETSFLLP